MEWTLVRLRILRKVLCLALITIGFVQQAAAQDQGGGSGQISLIRDAEIETIIRTWWTPVLNAAGLDPNATHIYIVNDPAINSFVAGGQNLFLNTGLLLKSQTANQVVGVMAHETGHIAGGHLARDVQAMHNATIAGIIAMAAGAAAAAASHSPDAGAAAVLGGVGVSEQSFLHFSVAQEAAADHAAMTFLDRAHESARGLLQFFEMLQQDELLTGTRENPYLEDHPLTRDRIAYVKEHVAQSPWSNVPDPPAWVMMHARMVAKLRAFLDPPSETLARYKAGDNSIPARYARAIAYYRIPELTKALAIIEGLIAQLPRDPYFEELKGQMLYENGHVKEALAPYERAVALDPGNALLKVELAQVELESNEPALVPKALVLLNDASTFESDNSDLWREMAVAEGRSGNMGMMALALAEQGMADGRYEDARVEAGQAMRLLPPGAQRQRAQDIANDAKRDRQRQRDDQ